MTEPAPFVTGELPTFMVAGTDRAAILSRANERVARFVIPTTLALTLLAAGTYALWRDWVGLAVMLACSAALGVAWMLFRSNRRAVAISATFVVQNLAIIGAGLVPGSHAAVALFGLVALPALWLSMRWIHRRVTVALSAAGAFATTYAVYAASGSPDAATTVFVVTTSVAAYTALFGLMAFVSQTLQRVEQQLWDSSMTDALTGLPNRRDFGSRGEAEVLKAVRHGRNLALLMFDIDRFKVVNDSFGHHVGDEVLKHVSKVASDAVRKTDILCRFGGEEFAVLLPETALDGAVEVAERIRRAMEEQRRPTVPPVTVSVGVASLNLHGRSLNELVASADGGLYRAKHGGRNRVEIAGEHPGPSLSLRLSAVR